MGPRPRVRGCLPRRSKRSPAQGAAPHPVRGVCVDPRHRCYPWGGAHRHSRLRTCTATYSPKAGSSAAAGSPSVSGVSADVSAAASAGGGRGGSTASRRCRSRSPAAAASRGLRRRVARAGRPRVRSCGVGRALTGREQEVEEATHPLGAALAETAQQRLVVRVVGEVDVEVSEREDLRSRWWRGSRRGGARLLLPQPLRTSSR